MEKPLANKVQKCPSCGHSNRSLELGIDQIEMRMECISCGNHWIVMGYSSFEERASTGLAVVDEVQITTPGWKEVDDTAVATPRFSKSAITAGVFDKSKKDDGLEFLAHTKGQNFIPSHIGTLSAILVAALVVSQIGISGLLNVGSDVEAIDPITTASVKKIEGDVEISNVKFFKIVRGSRRFINIRANARNMSGKQISNPMFSILLKDQNGKSHRIVEHEIEKSRIRPGETFEISRNIKDLGNTTKQVSIILAK